MDTLKVQDWRYRKEDMDLALNISSKLEIHPLLARLMVARGIKDAQSCYSILNPHLRNLHDPFLLGGMSEGVERITRAASDGERLMIHGDYDVDGITASALLYDSLKEVFGDRLDVFLPSRFEEGYGISPGCFDIMEEKGSSLLITVDCGIKAVSEIEQAVERGFDVIVTDHHEPGEVLPVGATLIDPKLEDDPYPFKELAGVGVAFKMATALQVNEVTSMDVRESLDLVAVGTISDLVPLEDENRTLVHFGIEKLACTDRLGLQMLMKEAGLEPWKGLKAGDVSFKLGPRLNAAGRRGHPDMALDLLLTRDRIDAELFSRELSTLNYKRQAIGKKLVEDITIQIEELGLGDDPAIIVAKEGWNPGVIGVSAARIMEIFGRPVVVISIEGKTARGSARSPKGFNMVEVLDSLEDVLLEHGGHERAAGLTIKTERIEEFRSSFNQLVDERYPDRVFTPVLDIDLDLSPGELDITGMKAMENLGPFGMSNPHPVVSIRDVSVGYGTRSVGNGKHLKFTVTDGDLSLDCIWFNMGELEGRLSPGSIVTIAGQPDIHRWSGSENVQMKVQDMSLSG
ncbi:MAG: single-stranded-DNA-specific exonuclease RecJ [Thermoplasmatota archaeon]